MVQQKGKNDGNYFLCNRDENYVFACRGLNKKQAYEGKSVVLRHEHLTYASLLLSGFLAETSGNYTTSFVLAGVTMVMASALMIYPVIYHRRQESKHLDVNVNLVCEKNIENVNCKTVNIFREKEVSIIHEKAQPLLDNPS